MDPERHSDSHRFDLDRYAFRRSKLGSESGPKQVRSVPVRRWPLNWPGHARCMFVCVGRMHHLQLDAQGRSVHAKTCVLTRQDGFQDSITPRCMYQEEKVVHG